MLRIESVWMSGPPYSHGRDVGEVVVVALRLALLGLVLLAEVAAAGLLAVERVAHLQLGHLHEVGDPERLLERLVEALGRRPGP